MRRHLKPDPSPEPSAIRCIDVDATGRKIVIGRHSSSGEHRLAIVDSESLEWLEDLSWSLSGAATFAHFLRSDKHLLVQDERSRVLLVSRAARTCTLVSADPVRYISTARARDMAALSGATVKIIYPLENRSADFRAAKDEEIAALDHSGSLLAVAGKNRDIEVVDVTTWNSSILLAKNVPGAHALEYDSSANYLAVIGWAMRGCEVWDLKRRIRVGEVFCNAGQNNNFCVTFHPHLPFVAFGTFSGYVVIVDLLHDDIFYMEKLHSGQSWDIKFAPDGSTLFSVGDDGVLWSISWDEMLSLGTSRVGS